MPLQQSGQTGQEKYHVFPESKTRFFYNETDVQNSPIETRVTEGMRPFPPKPDEESDK